MVNVHELGVPVSQFIISLPVYLEGLIPSGFREGEHQRIFKSLPLRLSTKSADKVLSNDSGPVLHRRLYTLLGECYKKRKTLGIFLLKPQNKEKEPLFDWPSAGCLK
jgi:hypothetical protein